MFWPEMISRWQRPGFLGGVLGQEPDFVVGSSFHGLWLLRDHMSYRLGCVYIYIYIPGKPYGQFFLTIRF